MGRALGGIVLGLAVLGLAACSSMNGAVGDGGPSRYNPAVLNTPNAVPKAEPKSRYGNPSTYVVNGRRYHVLQTSRGFQERGIASWYGTKFDGQRTSSGEPYNMYAMTAAHKELPIPSYVKVTNLANGRSVVVRVNDRGPFVKNRIIDLSYAAAAKLRMLKNGTAPVEVKAITPADHAVSDSTATGPAKMAPVAGGAIRYFVQVGAFAERSNAYRLSRHLRAMGGLAPVSVDPAHVDGRPLYRVRLGPLETVSGVDALTSTLQEAGIDDTHVVLVQAK